jgi:hypothetical protein
VDSFGFDGHFDSVGKTYTFSGINGSGTTSSAGANTITETISQGTRSSSIIFTSMSSAPSSYQVTSITDGSHTHTVTPTSNSPTFNFQYNASTQVTTVNETINNVAGTETLTYTSGINGNSTSYYLSSDTVVVTNPSTSKSSYSFTASGTITETDTFNSHTYTHTSTLPPSADLSGVGTGTVTETIVSGNSVTVETFVGNTSAGYALKQISTTYVPQGTSTTPLSINPYDRAKFDFTAQTVTWINNSGVAGTPQSTTANSKLSFADLGPASGLTGNFVGETITLGSHTSFEIYYSSTGTKGEYMEVAHGTGAASSVNLVGIASQISAVNAVHTFNT